MEGRAVVVCSVQSKSSPIPGTPAPAEGEVGTAKAVSGPAAALIQKGQGSRTLDGLFYRHLVDIAQIPLVQHKEVAGIEAAVPLHDQVASAGTRGGTGAGGIPARMRR